MVVYSANLFALKAKIRKATLVSAKKDTLRLPGQATIYAGSQLISGAKEGFHQMFYFLSITFWCMLTSLELRSKCDLC